MKKILILIVILLLSLQIVIAEEGIYDFVDSIVKTNNAANYAIVVGDLAPADDVLTTNDLVTSFNNLMQGSLDYKLVSEVSTSNNLILLGNPCDNSKIDEIIKCERWPYEEGEALIMVDGSNLIIAGTTTDDTKMAAHAIIDYKKNLDLKTEEVMVKGSLESYTFNEVKQLKEEVEEIEEEQTNEESFCGDGVCDIGEEGICIEDCFDEMNFCEEECMMKGFVAGICKQVTDECNEGEKNIGLEFCEEGFHCCCVEKELSEQEIQEERSGNFLSRFFKSIGNWFTNLF